ncbi:MAG: hypothetical protein V4576_01540 [Patescibacteria group bacterium]
MKRINASLTDEQIVTFYAWLLSVLEELGLTQVPYESLRTSDSIPSSLFTGFDDQLMPDEEKEFRYIWRKGFGITISISLKDKWRDGGQVFLVSLFKLSAEPDNMLPSIANILFVNLKEKVFLKEFRCAEVTFNDEDEYNLRTAVISDFFALFKDLPF